MGTETKQGEGAKSMTCSINRNDVIKSINFVHEAFTGNYGDNPILEGAIPVGSFKFSGTKVYINFRGALGVEFLPILLGNKLVPASGLGVEGNVHQSLLAASLALKPTILSKLTSYSSSSGLSIEQLQVILGGYSRGSALATLLAPILRLETEVQSIQCVTYGTLNIFDQAGASNYNLLVGDQNYVGFIAEEDLASPYLPYAPVGKNVSFSATKSKSYGERVQKGIYTYLDPIAAMALPFMGIGVDKWEAHMPTTYLEAIPELYQGTNSTGSK